MYSLEEARGWIEARVDDVYGSPVGRIVDMYFDPEADEVHWMLVQVGGDEGSRTLVPVHYSIATHTHVWVPITKDLIGRAPELEGAHALSRDDELELCFHYGGMRRRSEMLRRRPTDAVTAVPDSSVARFPRQARG